MIKLWNNGAYLVDGNKLVENDSNAVESLKLIAGTACVPTTENAAAQTMAYGILEAHNTSGNTDKLKIKFDKITSHDITFVGIIQTARASGLEKFPIPYVLTNCHNSLCAVGGTINEDDHMFGLTCAQKYGGVYVPPHQAVIHQFAREMLTSCGAMILGSDSHTRYGALGTLAIGEGGGELAKQLLCRTYDVNRPGVIAVYLEGELCPGVGPQDVALALIGATFENGYVKNKVLEFVGPGVSNLSVETRIGIDVMTTETTCLSSIWITDEKVEEYYEIHGRHDDYKELTPGPIAYYDGVVEINLSDIKPMIAMPFHPSNVYTIEEVNSNPEDILADVERRAKISLGDKVEFSLMDKLIDGRLYVDQGVIGGCAGGSFESISAAADILNDKSIGNGKFTLNVYPASMPIYLELMKNQTASVLTRAGAVMKTAFCGPCFGAGDTPANNAFSIRHSTRNFPNREGSKPQNGQIASVALMDARSIAATAANKGFLTPATEIDVEYRNKKYYFDRTIYDNRVYDSKGVAHPEVEIHFGPNIKNWPDMTALTDDLLVKVVSEIHDPVTTTDELIPSGETSSFRSNPLGLAEFTLSRKDPAYVGRAKEVREAEALRKEHTSETFTGILETSGDDKVNADVRNELLQVYKLLGLHFPKLDIENTAIGSTIYAVKPGDGSAREQAASCQKVLGGWANIAKEYATKRYRSNLINWGMIPFLYPGDELPFSNGDYVFIPGIKNVIENHEPSVKAYAININDGQCTGEVKEFEMTTGDLTEDERRIILAGCLINYYKH